MSTGFVSLQYCHQLCLGAMTGVPSATRVQRECPQYGLRHVAKRGSVGMGCGVVHWVCTHGCLLYTGCRAWLLPCRT